MEKNNTVAEVTMSEKQEVKKNCQTRNGVVPQARQKLWDIQYR